MSVPRFIVLSYVYRSVKFDWHDILVCNIWTITVLFVHYLLLTNIVDIKRTSQSISNRYSQVLTNPVMVSLCVPIYVVVWWTVYSDSTSALIARHQWLWYVRLFLFLNASSCEFQTVDALLIKLWSYDIHHPCVRRPLQILDRTWTCSIYQQHQNIFWKWLLS